MARSVVTPPALPHTLCSGPSTRDAPLLPAEVSIAIWRGVMGCSSTNDAG